jgi:hypothetical protein
MDYFSQQTGQVLRAGILLILALVFSVAAFGSAVTDPWYYSWPRAQGTITKITNWGKNIEVKYAYTVASRKYTGKIGLPSLYLGSLRYGQPAFVRYKVGDPVISKVEPGFNPIVTPLWAFLAGLAILGAWGQATAKAEPSASSPTLRGYRARA